MCYVIYQDYRLGSNIFFKQKTWLDISYAYKPKHFNIYIKYIMHISECIYILKVNSYIDTNSYYKCVIVILTLHILLTTYKIIMVKTDHCFVFLFQY